MQLTKKQNEYIREANHRWNIKSGAVRSGKSFVDTAYIIPYRIRERIGKNGLSVILGVSRDSIERNVLTPMRELYGIENIGIINSQNKAKIAGEEVWCLGAEKKSQVAKIQGSSIKYAYGDEIAKWNQEVFEMLKSRLDKPYSCFDGACNPEHPTHWLKEFIDSDADIYLQHYRLFDNEHLPPEYVAALCKEYEGTIYYDRLIEGLWKRAEGAIYRKFADNPDRYMKKPNMEEIYRIDCGVDFGGNGSGHSFVATGKIRDGRKHVLMSRKHMNADFRDGIDANILNELFLEFLYDMKDKYRLPNRVYYDNAETVLGQGLRKATKKVFPDVGVYPAQKKAINDRIQFVCKLIGADMLSLSDDCGTLSNAMQEAVWDPKIANTRLDDGSTDIDTLDAFEYSIERDFNEVRYNPVKGGI